VKETNISEWRRTVCGDLTSVFQSAEEASRPLPFPDKDEFIQRIYNARFKSVPDYHALSDSQIADCRHSPQTASYIPRQESGIRPARVVPYELQAEGRLSPDRRSLQITLSARKQRFGERASGSPFHVYAPGSYMHKGVANRTRSYAVRAGESLTDSWLLDGFPGGRYRLCVGGPNGFLLELAGDRQDPFIEMDASSAADSPEAQLTLSLRNNHGNHAYTAVVTHHAYGFPNQKLTVEPRRSSGAIINLRRSYGWYDFTVRLEGFDEFERRYAGHVETGRPSASDPQMGRISL
jgi:phospholipase C